MENVSTKKNRMFPIKAASNVEMITDKKKENEIKKKFEDLKGK